MKSYVKFLLETDEEIANRGPEQYLEKAQEYLNKAQGFHQDTDAHRNYMFNHHREMANFHEHHERENLDQAQKWASTYKRQRHVDYYTSLSQDHGREKDKHRHQMSIYYPNKKSKNEKLPGEE
jgi:hypothetical protein